MKISRNDLRRMILETLLREQDNSGVSGAGAGARKTRYDNEDESNALKSSIEAVVKRIVKDIAKDESFNGVITVGRMRTEVTRAEPEELGKKIERALEADNDLKGYKESLKRFRAFKITVNKAQNVEPEAEVEVKQEPEPKKEPDEYGPMGSEDLYIYRVNKATGCWETKKEKYQGPWISLKNNAKATNTLDTKYPNARTDGDKEKCKLSAIKKGAPSRGSRGTNSLTDAINTAIDGGILSVTTTNKVPELSSEKGINVAFNVSELDLLGEDLGLNNLPSQPGYMIIKKQKSGPGGPDNLIVGAAVVIVGENGTQVKFVNSNKAVIGGQNYTDIKAADFGDNKGANLGTAQGMLQKIVVLLNNVLSRQATSESYGKSHATLIRERYWGRY